MGHLWFAHIFVQSVLADSYITFTKKTDLICELVYVCSECLRKYSVIFHTNISRSLEKHSLNWPKSEGRLSVSKWLSTRCVDRTQGALQFRQENPILGTHKDLVCGHQTSACLTKKQNAVCAFVHFTHPLTDFIKLSTSNDSAAKTNHPTSSNVDFFFCFLCWPFPTSVAVEFASQAHGWYRCEKKDK